MAQEDAFYNIVHNPSVAGSLLFGKYGAVNVHAPDLFVQPAFSVLLKPDGTHRIATTYSCDGGDVLEVPLLPFSHYTGLKTDDVQSCGVAALVKANHKLLIHGTSPLELQALTAHGLASLREFGVVLADPSELFLYTNSSDGPFGQPASRDPVQALVNYHAGERSYLALLARLKEGTGLPLTIKPVDVVKETLIRI